MEIHDFISQYRNHPVLFIGTGVSLRYLNNSYTWDSLLKKIAFELKGSREFYLDIKSQCENEGSYDYTKIATLLEFEFNAHLQNDRSGKFKEVNDVFYEQMDLGIKLSRLKVYISMLFKDLSYKEEYREEINELKRIRKNIGSVITTNYDGFVESIFGFNPLVGNDILLSNPYGSVYKIHGCHSNPSKIIITEDDYSKFDDKYELIRAQLLSIFIHNPIIFIGYSISDENIKSLLTTIFTYVEPNSDEAEKIRNNFLLVEYEKNSISNNICEHDIDIKGISTIRINKIKTDNFIAIYKAISNLSLPVSAMDVRKVQDIVKEIYAGGSIQVNITENLDELKNNDKIIAIGSSKTITYNFQTTSEMMSNYFIIIEEHNKQLLLLINKLVVAPAQWFPIYAFSKICDGIEKSNLLKEQQLDKIINYLSQIKEHCHTKHNSIEQILADDIISRSNKVNAIFWSVYHNKIGNEDVGNYLRNVSDRSHTNYRKLLCVYDYKVYRN
jgi:hypothetical protein